MDDLQPGAHNYITAAHLRGRIVGEVTKRDQARLQGIYGNYQRIYPPGLCVKKDAGTAHRFPCRKTGPMWVVVCLADRHLGRPDDGPGLLYGFLIHLPCLKKKWRRFEALLVRQTRGGN
jgi:hypothetical protein